MSHGRGLTLYPGGPRRTLSDVLARRDLGARNHASSLWRSFPERLARTGTRVKLLHAQTSGSLGRPLPEATAHYYRTMGVNWAFDLEGPGAN